MLRTLFTSALAMLLAACGSSGPSEAQRAAMASVDNGAVLIDVRSPQEFRGGHLDGALLIPHTQIVRGVAKLGLPKDTPVVLYCRSGNRSGQATVSLTKAGYTNVTNAGDYATLKQLVAESRG